MTINCLAVDDEPLALGLLCAYIEQTPFLKLAGRYNSAVSALKAVHEGKIDVIFLDIQMPDLTGLDLARVLSNSKTAMPRIIFTTAYDQFALEGYKIDALDYLLKPFDYAEFLKAANKALSYVELLEKSNAAQPAPVNPVTVNTPVAEDDHNDYLFLKVEYQLVRVAFKDILYIESLKDYVKVWLLHTEKPILSLGSLKTLEEKLPAKNFMRVHRSFIVALDKINSITRNSLQIGKINVTVGDQYKDAFNKFISRWA